MRGVKRFVDRRRWPRNYSAGAPPRVLSSQSSIRFASRACRRSGSRLSFAHWALRIEPFTGRFDCAAPRQRPTVRNSQPVSPLTPVGAPAHGLPLLTGRCGFDVHRTSKSSASLESVMFLSFLFFPTLCQALKSGDFQFFPSQALQPFLAASGSGCVSRSS